MICDTYKYIFKRMSKFVKECLMPKMSEFLYRFFIKGFNRTANLSTNTNDPRPKLRA